VPEARELEGGAILFCMPKRDREEAGFFVKRTRKKRGKGGGQSLDKKLTI
jgi:hypothetical protein